MINFKNENDGIDHINIFSRGKTELGKFLSNFYYSPIITEDGEFNSIEGYWYWLSNTNAERNLLRSKYGWEAKKLGKEQRKEDWIDDPEFKRKIKTAIRIKLYTNTYFILLLCKTKLPLTHYYMFGTKQINVPEAEWILDIFREIQNEQL